MLKYSNNTEFQSNMQINVHQYNRSKCKDSVYNMIEDLSQIRETANLIELFQIVLDRRAVLNGSHCIS